MTEHTADERPALPELSDERIDELERALFAQIDDERRDDWNAQAVDTDRRRHRRRMVFGWSSAAAVVVIAAVIAGPIVTGALTPQASSGSLAIQPGTAQPVAPDTGSGREASGGASSGSSGGATSGAFAGRQIVATAQATVQVDDVAAAAKTIAAAAAGRGGYVESMNIGAAAATGPTAEPNTGLPNTELPNSGAPSTGDAGGSATAQGGTITVRVPADQLVAAVGALSALGTVQSTSISQQDVTSQAIDLRAQVDALQASVTRLTQLMSKAGSVADLLTAESALSKRQADLEAAQQQLKALENQVALSSLTVTLVEKPAPAAAAPSGFRDGLTAGWNGLVAVFDAVVIGLGFLLPWLVIAAVIGAIVWLVLRLRRRRRTPPASPPAQAVAPAPEGGPEGD